VQQLGMRPLVAVEGVHCAGELREAFQIAAALEMLAVHRGREARHLGAILAAIAGDQIVETGDNLLEQAAAAVEAVDAGVDQQAAVDEFSKETLLLLAVLAHEITGTGWNRACTRPADWKYCRGFGRC
jgi:hypothetical protein